MYGQRGEILVRDADRRHIILHGEMRGGGGVGVPRRPSELPLDTLVGAFTIPCAEEEEKG